MSLMRSMSDYQRRTKARGLLQSLLAKHQACIGNDVAPKSTAMQLIDSCWQRNQHAFAGRLANTEGVLAGVRQPKPRYQIIAVLALSEAVDAVHREMADSPFFFTLLFALRELLQGTAKEIGRGLIPGGIEEHMLRWGIGIYQKAVAQPEVQARYPALTLPLDR